MITLLPFILSAAFVGAAAAPAARTRNAPSQAETTASGKSLVEGSREAIIKTGVTADYFDRHFRVARVVDRPGDRRVVWTFSVGGYEATVSDSVGFYTEGGRRFDTHSVAGTLGSTSDLTRTLARPRAERLMRRCIGGFTNPQVEYRAHGPSGAAALLFTAEAFVLPRGAAREGMGREGLEKRGERERRERARRGTQGSPQADAVEDEDEGGGGTVVLLGAVDLSTGKCTVGRGQAGPPVPPRPRVHLYLFRPVNPRAHASARGV